MKTNIYIRYDNIDKLHVKTQILGENRGKCGIYIYGCFPQQEKETSIIGNMGWAVNSVALSF